MEREQGLFSAYFNAGQDTLRGKLNDCRDLTEVEDAVRLFWDSMQHDFTDKVTDSRERELGYELFVVAKSAISCMLSVSNADVLFKANANVQPRKEHKFDWKKVHRRGRKRDTGGVSVPGKYVGTYGRGAVRYGVADGCAQARRGKAEYAARIA